MKAFLNDIAPDFAITFVACLLGTFYARENLDIRSRETAMLAALMTKDNVPGDIKTRIV